MIKLRVYGTPAPQGSKSAFAVRKAGAYTGRVAIVDDNKAPLKSWRQAILEEARNQIDGSTPLPNVKGAAVFVVIVFLLKRPAGHYATGRAARGRPGLLKPSAPKRPAGQRMDLDKLARSTLDALTAAGIWADDGQVTELNLSKVYAGQSEPPGAIIEITEEDS